MPGTLPSTELVLIHLFPDVTDKSGRPPYSHLIFPVLLSLAYSEYSSLAAVLGTSTVLSETLVPSRASRSIGTTPYNHERDKFGNNGSVLSQSVSSDLVSVSVWYRWRPLKVAVSLSSYLRYWPSVRCEVAFVVFPHAVLITALLVAMPSVPTLI